MGHERTKRFKSGANPPIISVIRCLIKAFQFDLELPPEDRARLQRVVDDLTLDPHSLTSAALGWLERNAPKLFKHAANIEYAWRTLQSFGLKEELGALSNPNHYEIEEREPDKAYRIYSELIYHNKDIQDWNAFAEAFRVAKENGVGKGDVQQHWWFAFNAAQAHGLPTDGKTFAEAYKKFCEAPYFMSEYRDAFRFTERYFREGPIASEEVFMVLLCSSARNLTARRDHSPMFIDATGGEARAGRRDRGSLPALLAQAAAQCSLDRVEKCEATLRRLKEAAPEGQIEVGGKVVPLPVLREKILARRGKAKDYVSEEMLLRALDKVHSGVPTEEQEARKTLTEAGPDVLRDLKYALNDYYTNTDGTSIKVWDVEKRKPAKELVMPVGFSISELALSLDGRLLALGGKNGDLKIWDPIHNKEYQHLADELGSFIDLRFSADSKRVAAAFRAADFRGACHWSLERNPSTKKLLLAPWRRRPQDARRATPAKAHEIDIKTEKQ